MKRLLTAAALLAASTVAVAGGNGGIFKLPSLPTVVCPPNYGQSFVHNPVFNPVIVSVPVNAPLVSRVDPLWIPAAAPCVERFGTNCFTTTDLPQIDLMPKEEPMGPPAPAAAPVKPENG